MKIIITGCAGFIGFSIAQSLLKAKHKVIGIDNLNNYYSKKLKIKRLNILKKKKNFKFFNKDCSEKKFLLFILRQNKVNLIIHLAAEVGVRNSYTNPLSYHKNNIQSFINILEFCRLKNSNLIFASSSSVYGSRNKSFFKEDDNTSAPISYYAATKKCNEIMAYAYSKNYNFSAIGIRFFNVYGPWGRPDMSIFKFTEAMSKNKKIVIYGTGNQIRDFTYIEDAIGLINKIIQKQKSTLKGKFDIFNSGKGQCIKIKDLIKIISKKINRLPKIYKSKHQKGDVLFTNSSSTKIKKMLNYKPKITLNEGIDRFINWYFSIN